MTKLFVWLGVGVGVVGLLCCGGLFTAFVSPGWLALEREPVVCASDEVNLSNECVDLIPEPPATSSPIGLSLPQWRGDPLPYATDVVNVLLTVARAEGYVVNEDPELVLVTTSRQCGSDTFSGTDPEDLLASWCPSDDKFLVSDVALRDAAKDSQVFTVAAMTLHVVDYVLTKSTSNNPEAVQCMMGDLFAALERRGVIPDGEGATYRDEFRSAPEFYRLVSDGYSKGFVACKIGA